MTNQKWTNFSDADDQMSYELIPHKTIAKVRIMVKRGGYVTEEWNDGYVTKSNSSNSLYLACEFVVVGGEYSSRKIWSNIGLYSENSDKYADIGRSTIKAILNSARNLDPRDKSPQAEQMRNIKNFGDLNDLEVIAEILINDKGQTPKNEIKMIITPNHPKYKEYMQMDLNPQKTTYSSESLNKGTFPQGMSSGKYKIDYGKSERSDVVLDNDELPF